MTTRTYTITELAKEFDITNRTIRFYEDQGLVSPQREGQKRIYTPKDRVRLKLVIRGKRLGFTLAESRELIDMYDDETNNEKQLLHFLSILDAKDALLKQQLQDIEEMKIELDVARKRCLGALEVAQQNKK
jgi:DNA-binding transcriptional MerR regulator